MQQTVSIIGYGQTTFGEHWDKSLADLMRDAVDTALNEAQCLPTDIDAVVVGNMLGERLSSQAHLGSIASGLLPHQPPALRTEAACASGSIAVHTALALLESNKAKNVLVIGAEKMTDATTEEVSAALMGAGDSELDGPSGLTFPGIFGLIAQRYMHDYQLTRDDLSAVSVMHHRHAVSNPFAQFRREVTLHQVSSSPLVADPLRLLDCSPITDGAAACVLSTEKESAFRVAASQVSTDKVSLAERANITSFNATKQAMEHALIEASIDREDIGTIELHDCFSIAGILNIEDMGYASPGTGVELFKKDDTELCINASGGLKACGHPVGATGVKQIIDVCKRLKHTKERWGLAHNIGGAGATCAIHILEHAQ